MFGKFCVLSTEDKRIQFWNVCVMKIWVTGNLCSVITVTVKSFLSNKMSRENTHFSLWSLTLKKLQYNKTTWHWLLAVMMHRQQTWQCSRTFWG
jgi:hypothetical protein